MITGFKEEWWTDKIPSTVPFTAEILEALLEAKQIHREYPKDPVHMVALMVEEAGEAMQEANNILWDHGSVDDLRTELLHTVVTSIRCLEQIDEEEDKR